MPPTPSSSTSPQAPEAPLDVKLDLALQGGGRTARSPGVFSIVCSTTTTSRSAP
ncbi:hypothetical protein [Mobilicoccus caccae]|uniref:hypothetical protein n=1 Tax=Mobilicoccus caccae TaxID=1859295 RepID=UPI0024E14F9E|nr:hypothetical protein [Mobilicoccus caccae]